MYGREKNYKTYLLNIQYDIVILGAGIAGTSLAYLFRDTSFKILLLDRAGIVNKVKFGESLPPTSIAMLRRLKIEPLLKENAVHYKIYGYQSAWGEKSIKDYRFPLFPVNYGWKIDKTALVQDLQRAANLEVVFYKKRDKIEIADDGLTIISTSNQIKKIRGRLMVDATGRNSLIARQLGITRIHDDQLLSFTGNIKIEGLPDFSRTTLTESFSSGWGLISKLSPKRAAFSLFTIKHPNIANPIKDPTFLSESLRETIYLKHFFPQAMKTAFIGKSANSSRLTQTCGDNWLAIGDAALAFDPLCSHGITTAMYTAELAKKIIEKKLQANQPLLGYNQRLQQIYQVYLEQRHQIYRQEQRWATAPFWQLNHAVVNH